MSDNEKYSQLAAEAREQMCAYVGQWPSGLVNPLADAIDDQARQIAALEKERVPVLGAEGLTIPRSLWDQAWIAYCKKWSGSGTQRQHDRLLAEGFWVAELDDLVPNWRPVKGTTDDNK